MFIWIVQPIKARSHWLLDWISKDELKFTNINLIVEIQFIPSYYVNSFYLLIETIKININGLI
jgi:hypothetical protein